VGALKLTYYQRERALEKSSFFVVGGVEKKVLEEKKGLDYYSFGSTLPGRQFDSPEYAYGFNGKEKDDEIKNGEDSYDFGARIYDARIAQFISVDPFASLVPDGSVYSFAGNNPIKYIDYNGWFKVTPEFAAKYPSIIPILNALSNRVAGKSLDELRNDKLLNAFLILKGVPGSDDNNLKRMQDILTNGSGPVLSAGYPSTEFVGTTSGPLFAPIRDIDVFINEDLLDVMQSRNVGEKSAFYSFNCDEIAAMWAVYETLLHEAAHVLAKSRGVDEKKEGLEVGYDLDNILNPLKEQFGNINDENYTMTQEQLDRGDRGNPDPSYSTYYSFTLDRESVNDYFNAAESALSAISDMKIFRRKKTKSRKSGSHHDVRHL